MDVLSPECFSFVSSFVNDAWIQHMGPEMFIENLWLSRAKFFEDKFPNMFVKLSRIYILCFIN